MAIIQISKIQQRSGNIVDLPQLDEAEFGWATDVKRLYIGKTTPNENIEVLTSYSNISFSQINGSFGNLDIDGANIANGQILSYNGSEWTNKGGNIGGLITLGDVSNVKIDGGAVGYVLETDGSGNLSWTPKSTIIAFIQNATKANPGVITTTEDNFFVNGSEITITNVTGMTQLNGNTYFANVITSNSFSLYSDSALTTPVDTSGFGTFPNTTATATNSVNNRITVTSSAAFTINDPIVFKGTTFGGIIAGQTYYVLTKPTGTTMTISETVGGTVFPLITASGSCTVYVPGGRLVSLVTSGGGGGSFAAGGSNTMIQFNNTNLLDGSSDLTFNFGVTPKILTLNGNANVGNLNSTSSVVASTFVSNVSTGTQPITVSSTTRVANLNVDYANVSDFNAVTLQTTGTFFPTFVSSSATGNRALGANANLSFNVATGNLSTNILFANGNITGGNISTAGTGNIATLVVPTLANVTSTTAATSTTTGALRVAGGAGIAGNVFVGNVTTAGTGTIATIVASTLVNVTSTTAATSTTTGALQVGGGAGIGGNLWVGGTINGNSNVAATSITGNLLYGQFLQSLYPVLAPVNRTNLGNGTLLSIAAGVATGTDPIKIATDPTGRFVYVTNISSASVSQYSINQTTGALTSITTAIAAGSGPNGIAVDPTGRFVYVVNNAGSTVSQYSINQTTGALSSITTAIASGANPIGIAIDPTGRFVYVTNSSAGTVSQYSINQSTGALTSITTAIAAGNGPNSIEVDPTGRFVYVTNGLGASVSQYSINQSTGALTSITTAIASSSNPQDITIDPSGKFVYVANGSSSNITQYSINQSTGQLSSITSAVSAAGTVNGISVDPTGRYVYVTVFNLSIISVYSINQTTGALSSTGNNFGTDASPSSVSIDPTGKFLYCVNGGANSVGQFSINNFSVGSITVSGNITTTRLTTGANTTAGSITGNWTLTAGSRFQATYADLAEYYNADQYYEPGTVLEFGGVNEVTIATDGTNRVAGVVSTDPAYAMNAKCPGEHPLPIALQGRVPTKVRGTIRKGDMMVSAGDGYARPSNTPTIGSVIGKSLEDFNGVEGVIEIAIGRL